MIEKRFSLLGLAFGLVLGGVMIAALSISGKHSGNEARTLKPMQESQNAIPVRAPKNEGTGNATGVQGLKRSLDDATREMRALRAKVQALEHDGAETRRQVRELADDPSQFAREFDFEGDTDASAGASAPMSREQQEEEREGADAQVRAHLETLDLKARSERRDAKWAATAERQIKDSVLSSNVSGLTLVAAECRSTLCRVEMVADASAPPEGRLHSVLAAAPWPAGGVVEVADSGEVILYLAREGHELSK